MKMKRSAFALLPLMILCASFAHAQAGLFVFFAMGTAHDGSIGQNVDVLGTGNPLPAPSMGGVFGTLGGGVMLTDTLGAGAEVSFRFTQGDYAGAGYRPVFYDFNGIWAPKFGTKLMQPEIQAGFGGMSLRFYGGQQYCSPYTGFCSNYAGSSNHFQLHMGLGLRIFVKEHIFVRPQIDYHWVHNLNEFASDSVPEYSIAIGYASQ